MNILAIQEGHTSTAALTVDGEIVGCVSEERFLREKNFEGYPRNSINYLLSLVNKKIDRVVLCGLLSPGLCIVGREHTFSVLDHIKQQNNQFYPIFYENKNPIKAQKDFFLQMIKEKGRKLKDTQFNFNKNFKFTCDPKIDNPSFIKVRIDTISNHLGISKDKISLIDHHLGHVNYAYYASPFRNKDCVIVTADGDGDYGINATVSIEKNNNIHEIFRTDNQPIARLWRYFTLMLGMKPQQHEYKVMGMAPYADPYITRYVYEELSKHFDVENLKFKYLKKPQDLYFYFKNLFHGVRFDGLAGGLQLWTEKMLEKWIKNILKKTKMSHLVFSGGLAMNIKAMKVIANIPQIKNLYVAPSGGDESLPIGGCYYYSKKFKTPKPLSNIYLGPKYTTRIILKKLKKDKIKKNFKIKTNIGATQIAKFLKEGKTIARFYGRMEFGARALGNRSILADPSKFELIRKINLQIKKRDFWMPFTPIILKEREKDYIINPKNISSPYMTVAFDTTNLGKNHFSGAIHPYDQTIRPQILEKNNNPKLYKIIKSFEKMTGIGGLLNTSFNLHGEPIVNSPEDALHTLVNSDLDMLYFNDDVLLIRK